jgi:hypothetical protein
LAAGQLCGKSKESTAGWHGLSAWAVTTLIIFYLLSSAIGGVVGGAYRRLTGVTGGIASAAGDAVKTTAQTAAPSLEQSIRGVAGTDDPTALREDAIGAARAAVSGNEQEAPEARTRAADALAKAQNIPVEEARTRVSQYEQQYRQAVDTAKQKATDAAAVATKAVSRAALFGALALLLGGVAAWFGGRMGAGDPTATDMGRVPLARTESHHLDPIARHSVALTDGTSTSIGVFRCKGIFASPARTAGAASERQPELRRDQGAARGCWPLLRARPRDRARALAGALSASSSGPSSCRILQSSLEPFPAHTPSSTVKATASGVPASRHLMISDKRRDVTAWTSPHVTKASESTS